MCGCGALRFVRARSGGVFKNIGRARDCAAFKDLDQATLAGHDVPWGTGVCNTKGLLTELKRQNFKGAIWCEVRIQLETQFPIAKSVEWFHVMCAELVK